MKLIAALFAILFVAIVADAQTVIYTPPSAPSTPSAGYTYFNTITPNGQSHTGYVYTQPSSPTTGFQQNMSTGEQSTYVTSGNTITIFPLNSK